jgi:hypothetical protein
MFGMPTYAYQKDPGRISKGKPAMGGTGFTSKNSDDDETHFQIEVTSLALVDRWLPSAPEYQW